MQNEHAWDRLRSILGDMKLAIIAFSGGVDSSLLLRAASEVLGPNLIAVTALSETYPPEEIELAKTFAASLGVRHRLIPTGEMQNEAFTRNDEKRCYHCKRELFSMLRSIADTEGIAFIADGTNCDDLNDYRPGRRAAQEYSVRSPLVEAGLGKDEVRSLAKWIGLQVWDKPSLACLSSRIPHGTLITHELLRTIDAAEKVIRQHGMRQVRVRHHGDIARIEVAREDLANIMDREIAQQIVRSLQSLGYRFVTLDLDGYRTGSMNPVSAAEVQRQR